MEKLTILGSTGSIGTQALETAENLNLKISVLTAGNNHKLLEEQCRKYKPELCWIKESGYNILKTALADTNVKIITGEDALCEAVLYKSDTVLNSLVGISGLRPTLTAVKAGKKLALANKESLVTAGSIVMAEAKKSNSSILPVDSEHSAIFQCLEKNNSPKKVIITASGGSFFGYTKNQLENVTLEEALCHPNWAMGKKITIDSATLMNKGFEYIEAAHLFDLKPEQIDIIIHRESIVHSMVQFIDNSVIAQLGTHDMRLPIQYALTYPQRVKSITEELDLIKLGALHFAAPDYETFPLLKLAIDTYKKGGTAAAVLNGANEAAVELFLNKKISFVNISEFVSEACANIKNIQNPTINDIFEADKLSGEYIYALAKK